jgi:lipoate-protein ligase A
LTHHARQIHIESFIPDKVMVVMGASNQPDKEVNVDRCAKDGVPVMRRYGGGGTVVLYPGCVVVSVGTWVAQYYQNDFYFRLLNAWLTEMLALPLEQRGISDLAFAEKKVAGTSLFRSRNYLLFQASVLVKVDSTLISSYLQHPTREPEYRAKRSHGDFLTDLQTLSAEFDAHMFVKHVQRTGPTTLASVLGKELIEPQPLQFSAIEARLARAAED